ncbi:hypothetical protein H8356DRAFT_1344160 [Neocallimastix lanati (nom. inval.)]|nr:hypothetical protein H8356DRAFT_1344160 [Neocallimastix sp. JGI-2020a]
MIINRDDIHSNKNKFRNNRGIGLESYLFPTFNMNALKLIIIAYLHADLDKDIHITNNS